MTEGGEDKRTYTAVVAAEIGVVVVGLVTMFIARVSPKSPDPICMLR